MRQLDGLTPLHMAAMQRGGAAVAKTLLDAGADATLADNDGCTALHQALRLADHALFQTLHAALASAPPATDHRGVYLAGRACDRGMDHAAGLQAWALFPIASLLKTLTEDAVAHSPAVCNSVFRTDMQACLTGACCSALHECDLGAMCRVGASAVCSGGRRHGHTWRPAASWQPQPGSG